VPSHLNAYIRHTYRFVEHLNICDLYQAHTLHSQQL
jgi:hypothetical protein